MALTAEEVQVAEKKMGKAVVLKEVSTGWTLLEASDVDARLISKEEARREATGKVDDAAYQAYKSMRTVVADRASQLLWKSLASKVWAVMTDDIAGVVLVRS